MKSTHLLDEATKFLLRSHVLFSIRGIPIRIYELTFAWIAGIAIGLADLFSTFCLIFTFVLIGVWGSVLLHELGHAFMAMTYGIHVKQIVLLPIGGVAVLESIGRTPRQVIAIALAGPAISVLLFCLPMCLLSVVDLFVSDATRESVWFRTYLASSVGLSGFNLMILAFNLLPIYPLDGGRILEGFFSIVFSSRTALRISYLTAVLGGSVIAFIGAIDHSLSQTMIGSLVLIFGGGESRSRLSKLNQITEKHPTPDQL